MKTTIIKSRKNSYNRVTKKLNSLKSFNDSNVGRLNGNSTNHLDKKGLNLINLITFNIKKTSNLGSDFEHTFYYDVETNTTYQLDVNFYNKFSVVPAFEGDFKEISNLK